MRGGVECTRFGPRTCARRASRFCSRGACQLHRVGVADPGETMAPAGRSRTQGKKERTETPPPPHPPPRPIAAGVEHIPGGRRASSACFGDQVSLLLFPPARYRDPCPHLSGQHSRAPATSSHGPPDNGLGRHWARSNAVGLGQFAQGPFDLPTNNRVLAAVLPRPGSSLSDDTTSRPPDG